jgi:hypothetical protein
MRFAKPAFVALGLVCGGCAATPQPAPPLIAAPTRAQPKAPPQVTPAATYPIYTAYC